MNSVKPPADGAAGALPWSGVARERSRLIIGTVQALPRAASIVVPTFREAPNLAPLITRILAATRDTAWTVEIIVVDDNSCDGTEEIVRNLAIDRPVRLIVRRSERGLASAVLTGFSEARYDRFVVLDADLQHPPEFIPHLLSRLEETGCDFVLGTRYGHAGSIAKTWPWGRRLSSQLATLAARPLARVSDPMSGFFALPRRVWERSDRLDPIGYKIALELIVKGRCRHVEEVPIQFELRQAGASKFGLRQAVAYAGHLVRLYRFRFPWLTTTLAAASLGGMVGLAYVLLR